jgi:hypothetical protein
LGHFLFDFALPWLDFRNAIRSGDHQTMDSMYSVILPWFRSTNKNNYARICLDYILIIRGLNRELLGLWQKYRTCSLLGNQGRNIAWDQANEFMNLDVKQTNPSSVARINDIITMLNGLRAADGATRNALGMQRDPISEYTPVTIIHVGAIIGALESSLGANRAQLQGHHASNFGNGPLPWIHIENFGANLPILPINQPNPRREAATEWILQRLQDPGVPW